MADHARNPDIDREYLPSRMREVAVERAPAGQAKATFAVRLDPADVAEIRRLAADVGVGATQLVRRWVLERLRAEQRHAVPRASDEVLVSRVEAAVKGAMSDVIRTVDAMRSTQDQLIEAVAAATRDTEARAARAAKKSARAAKTADRNAREAPTSTARGR